MYLKFGTQVVAVCTLFVHKYVLAKIYSWPCGLLEVKLYVNQSVIAQWLLHMPPHKWLAQLVFVMPPLYKFLTFLYNDGKEVMKWRIKG